MEAAYQRFLASQMQGGIATHELMEHAAYWLSLDDSENGRGRVLIAEWYRRRYAHFCGFSSSKVLLEETPTLDQMRKEMSMTQLMDMLQRWRMISDVMLFDFPFGHGDGDGGVPVMPENRAMVREQHTVMSLVLMPKRSIMLSTLSHYLERKWLMRCERSDEMILTLGPLRMANARTFTTRRLVEMLAFWQESIAWYSHNVPRPMPSVPTRALVEAREFEAGLREILASQHAVAFMSAWHSRLGSRAGGVQMLDAHNLGRMIVELALSI